MAGIGMTAGDELGNAFKGVRACRDGQLVGRVRPMRGEIEAVDGALLFSAEFLGKGGDDRALLIAREPVDGQHGERHDALVGHERLAGDIAYIESLLDHGSSIARRHPGIVSPQLRNDLSVCRLRWVLRVYILGAKLGQAA